MQEQGAWKSLYAARHAVCNRNLPFLEVYHYWMVVPDASLVADHNGFAYIG